MPTATVAEVAEALSPAAPAADAPAVEAVEAEKPKYPAKARVYATRNPLLHLHRNKWISNDPDSAMNMEIDDFVTAQLDAGKLAIAD